MHFSGQFNASMSESEPPKLLEPAEPEAVSIYKIDAKSPLLLVADHAGNLIPRSLGRLGLTETDCERHIAWDIGIAGLARLLAEQMDATLIKQNYSRLVIDCNRPLEVDTSIARVSENTPVPGNASVSDRDRAARITEIFQPYHAQIESELDRRQRGGRPTALIALHSFTPVFEGLRRPWHAAVLYNRDGRLARQLLMLLEENKTLVVADNKPYVISNTTDHTIPIHGEQRGLPHVLVEIRQDLIEDEVGRREWALRLADLLPKAYERLADSAQVISTTRNEQAMSTLGQKQTFR
jgi:predicted N-formylglutamate amidohydrolase